MFLRFSPHDMRDEYLLFHFLFPVGISSSFSILNKNHEYLLELSLKGVNVRSRPQRFQILFQILCLYCLSKLFFSVVFCSHISFPVIGTICYTAEWQRAGPLSYPFRAAHEVFGSPLPDCVLSDRPQRQPVCQLDCWLLAGFAHVELHMCQKWDINLHFTSHFANKHASARSKSDCLLPPLFRVEFFPLHFKHVKMQSLSLSQSPTPPLKIKAGNLGERWVV